MTGFQAMTRQLTDRSFKISLKGFVDSYTCDKLEEVFNRIFGQGIYTLFIDLSRVHYVSCTGIGVLMGALGLAKDNNGSIVLVNPSLNVKETLKLLGLTSYFTVTQESEEGFDALNLSDDDKSLKISCGYDCCLLSDKN